MTSTIQHASRWTSLRLWMAASWWHWCIRYRDWDPWCAGRRMIWYDTTRMLPIFRIHPAPLELRWIADHEVKGSLDNTLGPILCVPSMTTVPYSFQTLPSGALVRLLRDTPVDLCFFNCAAHSFASRSGPYSYVQVLAFCRSWRFPYEAASVLGIPADKLRHFSCSFLSSYLLVSKHSFKIDPSRFVQSWCRSTFKMDPSRGSWSWCRSVTGYSPQTSSCSRWSVRSVPGWVSFLPVWRCIKSFLARSRFMCHPSSFVPSCFFE